MSDAWGVSAAERAAFMRGWDAAMKAAKPDFDALKRICTMSAREIEALRAICGLNAGFANVPRELAERISRA